MGEHTGVEGQARASLQRGDLTSASSGFTSLAAQPGTRAAGCYGLALVLDREGRRADARAMMRDAVAADSHHANALYYLGLWAGPDERDQAVEYLRRCLQASPTHAGARTLLQRLSAPSPTKPVEPQRPSPPTPPASSTIDRLRPPRDPRSWDDLVGFVVDLSERAEGRNSSAFGVRVYELVIQGVDEAGRRTLVESVEMRGAGRVGTVSKGHWVEVARSAMKGRNGASVTRLRNLTTGQDVVVRGVWSSASGRRGVYVIAPLVVLALMGGGFWWAVHRGLDGVGSGILTVPDVSGQKGPDLAVQQLKAAGFTSVSAVEDAGPEAGRYAPGSVEGTRPPAGSSFPAGLTVDVVVAAPSSTPSSTPPSTPLPTSAPGPTQGPTTTTGPAPTSTGSAGAPVSCADAAIQAREGRRLGANAVVLLFTNVSSSSCTLAGYPGVQLVDASGQRVDVPRSLRGLLGGIPVGQSTYPRPVLGPGSVASAVLESTASPAPDTPGPDPTPTVTATTPPSVSPTMPPPWTPPAAWGVTPPTVSPALWVGSAPCPTYVAVSVIAPNTSRVTLLTTGITGCAPTVHPVVAGVSGG